MAVEFYTKILFTSGIYFPNGGLLLQGIDILDLTIIGKRDIIVQGSDLLYLIVSEGSFCFERHLLLGGIGE